MEKKMTEPRNIFEWGQEELYSATKSKVAKDKKIFACKLELFLMILDYEGGYANFYYGREQVESTVVTITHAEMKEYYKDI